MSIQVKELSVTLSDLPILANLNFTVEKNEFVALIGPSGSGKSTLFKTLTGVIPPATGSIHVDDTPVVGLNQLFSYMPQDDILFDWYDVAHNATLYQKIHRQKVDQLKLTQMLTRFGLEDYRHFLPSQLSGGMRQRVALLRTMMVESDYLLLDEPFGALDAMTRSVMQDWFLEISQELKQTTLLVTHDIEEAIYLADRIIVLSARPAKILKEYHLAPAKRDRSWLSQTGALKEKIYQLLRGETDVH